MLMAGKGVTVTNEPLIKLTVEQLYKSLVNPKQEIESQIAQLRTLMTIDPRKYNQLKRNLPYVTCGIFHPPYRKTENFAAIEVFIVDVDHCSEKGFTAESLKEKLKNDQRVELMFISPGADGLKILFRLAEKCYDHVQYSLFYRAFVEEFSRQYELNQVIDVRTSDVTRACFISVDREAYYNPDPEKIRMEQFINFNDPDQVARAQELLKQSIREQQEKAQTDQDKAQLNDEILDAIRQRLNPDARKPPRPAIHVPEQLEPVIKVLPEHMSKYGITVEDVKNIHYGKQIKFTAGSHFSVINLYYGKRGFVIVVTTKTGSNQQLGELVRVALSELLYPPDPQSFTDLINTTPPSDPPPDIS